MANNPRDHILIVDEDQLLLYALARALTDGCSKLTTTARLEDAIAALSNRSYDLCLLSIDFRSPERLKTVAEIIGETCPHTQVILLSTNCSDLAEQKKRVLTALKPDTCCVAKPFNLADLVFLVNQMLHRENSSEKFNPYETNDLRLRRKSQRKSYCETICFQIGLIREGENKRLEVEAQTTDISDTGIGLKTWYPLTVSQVISFDSKMKNQTGVVVWSESVEARSCRAGIRFS